MMTHAGSKMRRLTPKILLLICSIAVITGVLYIRFLGYRASLQFFETAHEPDFLSRDFSPLSAEALLQLGTAHSSVNRPASSYQFQHTSKPPETLRIGVFGCSFARGAETSPGGDFPTLLQRKIQGTSTANVEVINFGVGGYGFQQAYLLWQELGASYNLDYTIFHLFSFHKQRDATFVQLHDAYGPVHGRYILNEEKQLEFIPVSGKDRAQALGLYFRFIPLWRYLRFDIKPPPIARSMIFGNGQLEVNPFYYFDGAGEVAQIYTLFLEDLIENSPNFIAGANDEESFSLRKNLPDGDDHFFRMWTPQYSWRMPGLYRAQRGHLSALGNKIAAAEYRSLLTGERQTSFQLASRSGWSEATETVSGVQDLALDSAKEVFFAIDSEPVGVFVTTIGKTGHTLRFSFAKTGTRSLIDITVGSKILYLPLRKVLETGSEIEVQIHFENGETHSAAVGKIEEKSGVLGRLVFRNAEALRGQPEVAFTKENGQPQVEVSSDRQVASLRVLMNGESILKGVPKSADKKDRGHQVFNLVPNSGSFVTMRAHPLQSPDVLTGLQSATVSVVAISKNGAKRTIPAFHIEMKSAAFPERHSSLMNPIELQ